ncbi:hypothetical protein SDC9_21215 [bioreactor metagenome]|uniref:Uncharacterized protein n=1 Tax=bioreactor metagenome TaxID=1076179 RepID=A0A644U8X4_9ZZZZ
MPNPKNPWRYKNDPDYKRRVDAHDTALNNKRIANKNSWSELECICTILAIVIFIIVLVLVNIF